LAPGIPFIIKNYIGLITPPVGTVLNTVAGVGRMKMDAVTVSVNSYGSPLRRPTAFSAQTRDIRLCRV